MITDTEYIILPWQKDIDGHFEQKLSKYMHAHQLQPIRIGIKTEKETSNLPPIHNKFFWI